MPRPGVLARPACEALSEVLPARSSAGVSVAPAGCHVQAGGASTSRHAFQAASDYQRAERLSPSVSNDCQKLRSVEPSQWMPRCGTNPTGMNGSNASGTGENGSVGNMLPAPKVQPTSERLALSAGSTSGGPQLAVQLAQFAHARAAQGWSRNGCPAYGSCSETVAYEQRPTHAETDTARISGDKDGDEAVQQQLLALALRACRTGGTGVGDGDGMPVGLSELYKLGKAIGEGAFGFVRVAQQRLSRELIAVKTFEKVLVSDLFSSLTSFEHYVPFVCRCV